MADRDLAQMATHMPKASATDTVTVMMRDTTMNTAMDMEPTTVMDIKETGPDMEATDTMTLTMDLPGGKSANRTHISTVINARRITRNV